MQSGAFLAGKGSAAVFKNPESVPKDEAQSVAKKLEEAGAAVEVR